MSAPVVRKLPIHVMFVPVMLLNRRRRKRMRTGSSMLEMICVIIVSTTFISVATPWFIKMVKMYEEAQQSQSETIALQDWLSQLRSDASQADLWTLNEGNLKMTLKNGQQVEWYTKNSTLQRSIISIDPADSATVAWYRLPSASSMHLERLNDHLKLVRIDLEITDKPSADRAQRTQNNAATDRLKGAPEIDVHRKVFLVAFTKTGYDVSDINVIRPSSVALPASAIKEASP